MTRQLRDVDAFFAMLDSQFDPAVEYNIFQIEYADLRRPAPMAAASVCERCSDLTIEPDNCVWPACIGA